MDEITLRTEFPTAVDRDQVCRVLDSALRHEAELADAPRGHFERACRAFERQHHMSLESLCSSLNLARWVTMPSILIGMPPSAAATCGSDAFVCCRGSRFEGA